MSVRISEREYQRLSDVPATAPEKPQERRSPRKRQNGTRAPAAPRSASPGEAAFAAALRRLAPDIEAPAVEATFYPGRRWRFDFAWSARRVAVEVDGGQWAPRGGRHASDADRDKLNHATSMGWRVLRFSPSQIDADPDGCIALLRRALGLTD